MVTVCCRKIIGKEERDRQCVRRKASDGCIYFSPGDKSTAAAPAFVFIVPLKQQTATEVTVSTPLQDQVEKAALGVSDITFVSESQSQSNGTRQKKKPRRKKAPIYWGKKPSRRKLDVKQKLDSEIDQVTQEFLVEVNGEQAKVSGEAFPDDSGDRSTNEETEKDPGVISDKEGDVANHQEDDDEEEEEEEDDVELMENGVAPIDGDVVLLHPENLTAEIKSGKVNSESVLQNNLVVPTRPIGNHDLSAYQQHCPVCKMGSPQMFAQKILHRKVNVTRSLKVRMP